MALCPREHFSLSGFTSQVLQRGCRSVGLCDPLQHPGPFSSVSTRLGAGSVLPNDFWRQGAGNINLKSSWVDPDPQPHPFLPHWGWTEAQQSCKEQEGWNLSQMELPHRPRPTVGVLHPKCSLA